MIRHTGQIAALFIEEELNTFEQKPDRIDGKAQFIAGAAKHKPIVYTRNGRHSHNNEGYFERFRISRMLSLPLYGYSNDNPQNSLSLQSLPHSIKSFPGGTTIKWSKYIP